MKKYVLLTAAVLFAGLLWTGCQQPPAEEITVARQALSAVDEDTAREYAPAELEEATAALDAANDEVEAQDQRFALTRNYDEAKELLARATEKANAAQVAAANAKARARSDAETALADLRTGIEEATVDLAALGECRTKPKGFEADLEALSGSLEALTSEVTPIESAFAAEEFNEANVSIAALSDSTSMLRTDLRSARERLRC